MVGSLGFLLTRSAQVEHHRAMHRRAFTKAVPIGSEISPEMTIPSIRVQAAKKRQYVKSCVKVQGPVEPELELAWSAC